MPSSTTSPDLLAPRLAAYLGAPVARIAILDSGWETTIYEFTIAARSPRTPDLPVNSPLVLRLFDGVRAEDKAAREARVFFYLAGAKYPVPRPYLYETTRDALGAPFLLMDRVAGGPLFSATSFPVAFKTFSLGFIAFVRAQVRLHRLDASALDLRDSNRASGFDLRDPNCADHQNDMTAAGGLLQSHVSPSIPAAASLLDRMLATIADRVVAGPLPGLTDALASLRERAGRYRPAPFLAYDADPDRYTPDAPRGGYDASATPRVHADRSASAAPPGRPASDALSPVGADATAASSDRSDRSSSAPAAMRDHSAADSPSAARDALATPHDRAARSRAEPDSIVHMDYHPQNVIVRGFRVTGVIDWVSADRGDRHLDAATTSVILATSAMDRPRWMRDNPAGNSLRALFAGLYFPAYHALAPMDLDRFRYCQAVAALFRLSTFGMMRACGPESVGYRPAAIANVTPDVVRLLSRYTSRKSGTPATLPLSPDPLSSS